MITGAQCRAARALVEWTREYLATNTGVDIAVIESFERRLGEPYDAAREKIREALEAGGALFLPEDDGGGVGVRLKFSRADVRRIAVLEGEGGAVGMDDVP